MAKCKKGFKMKGGKCVRKKSSSGKKSKNPFKMLGAYIGAGVGLVIFAFSFIATIGEIVNWINPVTAILTIIFRDAGGGAGLGVALFTPLIFLSWIVLGFLVGWVIQLIVRRIRK